MGSTVTLWLVSLPHSTGVSGSDSPAWGLSGWTVHVLPVLAWVLTVFSGLLPQSKDMHTIGGLATLNCFVSVNVRVVCLCMWPCDRVVTSPGCAPRSLLVSRPYGPAQISSIDNQWMEVDITLMYVRLLTWPIAAGKRRQQLAFLCLNSTCQRLSNILNGKKQEENWLQAMGSTWVLAPNQKLFFLKFNSRESVRQVLQIKFQTLLQFVFLWSSFFLPLCFVSGRKRVPVPSKHSLCSKLCAGVRPSACSSQLGVFVPPINPAVTSHRQSREGPEIPASRTSYSHEAERGAIWGDLIFQCYMTAGLVEIQALKRPQCSAVCTITFSLSAFLFGKKKNTCETEKSDVIAAEVCRGNYMTL